MGNRESDQARFLQLQLDNVKKESASADEQIANVNQQCKQYQNQMEVRLFFFFSFENLNYKFS